MTQFLQNLFLAKYQKHYQNGGFLKDIFPHSKNQKIMKHYLTIVGWSHTNIYVNQYKIDKFNIPKPEIVFCFNCNLKQICTVQNYWFCKRNCKTTQRNSSYNNLYFHLCLLSIHCPKPFDFQNQNELNWIFSHMYLSSNEKLNGKSSWDNHSFPEMTTVTLISVINHVFNQRVAALSKGGFRKTNRKF